MLGILVEIKRKPFLSILIIDRDKSFVFRPNFVLLHLIAACTFLYSVLSKDVRISTRLCALINNEPHSIATPGGNLLTVSGRIVSRSAVYVSSITIALDLVSVRVEQCKAIATSGENLYLLSEMLFIDFRLQRDRLTPSLLVSVPTSKDCPCVKVGSPKTVIAETNGL